MRDRLAPAALAAGVALLGLAWAMANPPWASPDEPANYVKAYATATGQLRGERYTRSAALPPTPHDDWYHAAGRIYRVPGALVPPGNARCHRFDPELTAACLDVPASREPGDVAGFTQMGTYEPFAYVPAGMAMRTAAAHDDALRRGRVVGALVCAALLGVAAWLLAGGGAGLVGLLLAVTPMVVFLGASVTTNGIEIAAAVCLWASVLRLRAPPPPTAAVWWATGVAGSLLALSRLLDPVYVAVILSAGALLLGATRTRELLRTTGGRVALGAIGAACLVTLAWDVVVMPHPPLDLGVAGDALGPSWRSLPEQGRQLVGVFGWLDTRLADPVYVAFGLAVAAITAVAVARGPWRLRVTVVALVAGVVAVDLAVATLVEAQIAYGMQARYVLPLAVGVPLVAATPLRGRVVAAVVGCGVAALHVVAFAVNAHRYAVGRSGAWSLPWSSEWAPPGGHLLWFSVAAVGALCLAAAGVLRGGYPAAASSGSRRIDAAFSTARRARVSRRSSTGSSLPPASIDSRSRSMARSASSSAMDSSR